MANGNEIAAILHADGTVSYPNAGRYFDDENTENLDSNNVQTSFKRDSNNIQTSFERDSNGVQIKNSRRTSQTGAALAAREKEVAETPQDFVELHPDVVDLLNDRRFVKSVIGRGKPKCIFSIPEPLQNAINEELGENFKPGMLNKIHFCNEYTKRFSPAAFWGTVMLSIMALGGTVYLMQPTSAATATGGAPTASRETDSLYIESWAKKRNFEFFKYRYGLMLSDSTFILGDKPTRERIMEDQMDAQRKAVSAKSSPTPPTR